MNKNNLPKDWRVLLLIAVVLLIALFFKEQINPTSTPDSSDSVPTVEENPTEPDTDPTGPTPSDPSAPIVPIDGVTLYTTTPFLVYPDVAAERTKSPMYQAFLADLVAAKSTIDIAVFDIDLPELRDALLAADKRGVTVRVAYDDTNLTDARVAQVIGALQDANIAVIADEREPFMHEKIAAIDDTIVWTGSWNMTFNDTYRNNNSMLRFVNSTMATMYHQEVDQLMGGAFGVGKVGHAPYPTIELPDGDLTFFFSPVDDINKHVVAAIKAAKKSVRFMAFSYTDKAISQAMIAAHKRDLLVQGVMENQNVKGTGSAWPALESAGVDILRDGNCYIMHHKTIIIDDEIVITGSYNFTKSAEQSNDENLLIINSPSLAAQFIAEYKLVRAQAEQPTQCGK
jgi:phosphatidylserine/phosphatidylglycerophosphate/cardiolipin synthase-like enzyme